MDLLPAVSRRISRRSYLREPIDENSKTLLLRFLDGHNSQSGLSFSLLEDGGAAFSGFKSYGLFSGVRSLVLLKGKETDEYFREKVGYYGEMAVLFATLLGLGTCWVAGSYDKDSKAFQIPQGERLVAVVPVGKVRAGMSVKEKAIHSFTHRHGKTVSELLQSDGNPPEWVLSAMESVKKAPSAQNSQRVTFSYRNAKLTASVPGNRFTDLIDLGITKLHFELAAGGRFDWGNGGVCRPAP